MNKSSGILIFLLFIVTLLSAQDIAIRFQPAKTENRIDSIWITNLKTNQKIKIGENELLLLVKKNTSLTGNLSMAEKGSVYPNPCNGKTKLFFPLENQSDITVTVCNSAGKVLLRQNQELINGLHQIDLSFPREGLYFVSVYSAEIIHSFKILNMNGHLKEENVKLNVSPISNQTNKPDFVKSLTIEKSLEFTPGDILYCSSHSGNNTTILTVSPAENKTFQIEFYECKDQDNKDYPVVKIGNQWWMAKNLAVLPAVMPANSGSANSPSFYVYGYQGTSVQDAKATVNYQKYGTLYNWSAAINGNSAQSYSVKGNCPAKWHLPGDQEWETLIQNTGSVSTAGSKLKETGILSWNTPNLPATNETGFTAPGGGLRSNSGFSDLTINGIWWSSSFGANPVARLLSYNKSEVLRTELTRESGLSVRCIKDEPPVVTTSAVGSISQTLANGGGNIQFDGGSAVLTRGVCWGTSPKPDITGIRTTNGSGSGTFTSVLSELLPGSTYFVRAYATNNAGTGYGNEISFSTLTDANLPFVTTNAITGITQTSATCGGNITSDGGVSVTLRGVCWGTNQNPDITGNKTSNGTGTGTFGASMSQLQPGTIYYVRAYAINNAGIKYGNQVSFTTLPIINLPSVTTASMQNITQVTATTGGNVISDGGDPETKRGVCWGTNPNPDITGNKTSNGTGTGVFTVNLTNLLPGTIYYIRAWATNQAGTAYGNHISFTTQQSVVLPGVTTNTFIQITQNSATGGGNVISDGGSTVLAKGICWGINPNPDISGNKTSNGSGTGAFEVNLTNLNRGTIYYARAYATNSAGTGYGNQVSFTTTAEVGLPLLSTSQVIEITKTTATSGGEIISDGGADVTARGVCWDTRPNPVINANKTINGTGTGAFTSTITGLSPGTTYYLRAYATNSQGTEYGDQQIFATISENSPAMISTANVSGIAKTSAICGGNVTSEGGSPVTSKGVCWGTETNPDITGNKTTNGSGTGAFTSALSNLTPGTTYYIRAYATNIGGTAYGNTIVFNTLYDIVAPSVQTNPVTNITQNSATGGGNVTSTGGGEITARGICWGTNPNPDITGNKTSNGTGTGNFTSNLTGLQPAMTYYVRAYATNSAGTAYGSQQVFTTSGTSQLPNFLINSLTVNNNNPERGQTITLSFKAVSDGLKGNYTPYVGFYASLDAVWSPESDFLGQEEKLTFTATNNELNASGSFEIPTNIPPGTYYFICVIDNKLEYTESNETDNVQSVRMVIR